MKKFCIALFVMAAVTVSLSTYAQDKKVECPKAKTECAKACDHATAEKKTDCAKACDHATAENKTDCAKACAEKKDQATTADQKVCCETKSAGKKG
jgi:hypothetical protein